MKKRYRVLVFLSVIVPAITLIYLEKDWQTIATIEMVILLGFAISNYDKFTIISFSKEGVELRRNIEEARVIVKEVSDSMNDTLKILLDQVAIVGGPPRKLLGIYNNALRIRNEYSIQDKELDKKILLLENSVSRHSEMDLEGIKSELSSILKSVSRELFKYNRQLPEDSESTYNVIIDKINKYISCSENGEIIHPALLVELADDNKELLSIVFERNNHGASNAINENGIYDIFLSWIAEYKKAYEVYLQIKDYDLFLINTFANEHT